MSQTQSIAPNEGTPTTAAAQTTAVSPSKAGQIASANADSNTTISSMADLREKSPKVYNMMIESMGRQICSDMKKHSDKLKKQLRS